MALDLAAEGAVVVVVDRDDAGVGETRALLDPESSLSVSVDLLEDTAAAEVVDAAVEAFGGVDILVNCAGIFPTSPAAVARPGIAHYCASKAGLVMLTKALAIEWAEHGVRVNAVAPGLVETPGVERLLRTEEGRAEHRRKVARIPMSRPADVREVSEAVLFLASDAAGFVTGETLFVDGGYSAGRTFRD